MTSTTEPSHPPTPADLADPRLGQRRSGPGGWLDVLRARLRGGELGPIPVVLGLVLIAIIFQSLNDVYLSPRNLVNLTQQIAAVGTISIGVVLVLLLGEIDLSVGSVSGLAAAVCVVMNVNQGWPAIPAVAFALLVGAVIGLFQGLVFSKIGVPSFVVTLAGLLIWLGLQLAVLGEQGTINLPPTGGLIEFGQLSFLNEVVAYVLAIAVAAFYLLARLTEARRRRAAELSAAGTTRLLVQAGLLALGLVAVTWVLQQNRGVSYMLVLFLALVVFFDFITKRTRYGRFIFAIGGNVEAARRAGINVDRIRYTVFALCSLLAALGGILATARLGSASQQSGQGDVLINAIAAAVIGGTSLFGGRGSTYAALLGILVIGAISNGLTLVDLGSAQRFMITGGVLLAAVTIDALSRRGQRASGRA